MVYIILYSTSGSRGRWNPDVDKKTSRDVYFGEGRNLLHLYGASFLAV